MALRLQNSYIFIPNPYKKEEPLKNKSDGGIHIDFSHNFFSYFKSIFPAAKKMPEDDKYFTSRYSYVIELNGTNLEVAFLIHEVVETYYLDVIIVGKNKIKIIEGLERIQTVLEKSEISHDYIEIISFDAISEYYCNKIYPKLNELERNLRKLLFNIYVVNFGRAYYQTTISDDLQSKVKSVIQAKGNDEKKETERLQKFFYSMEFVDIQQMLFVPRWAQIDQEAKDTFLRSHSDLTKLTDRELREAFSEIAPKSDWERFFADKMDADIIRLLIDEIRQNRNNIAHCKFFYREEYLSCSGVMNKFNKAILLAIAKTADKDFSEKNGEGIKSALAGFAKVLDTYKASFAKAVHPVTQALQVYSDMIAPIRESVIKNALIIQKTLRPTMEFLSTFRDTILHDDRSLEQLQDHDVKDSEND